MSDLHKDVQGEALSAFWDYVKDIPSFDIVDATIMDAVRSFFIGGYLSGQHAALTAVNNSIQEIKSERIEPRTVAE